jgi:DNA-binding NtrC family response regulator
MLSRKPNTSKTRAAILMIDENAHGLTARKAVLEEQGHTVTTTESLQHARELFESETFEMVITDHKMPRVNGLEMIQFCRSIKPQVRIVLLSGFVETLGLTAQSTGADAVVQKSAHEVPQLIRVVARALTSKATPKRKATASEAPPSKAKRHSA